MYSTDIWYLSYDFIFAYKNTSNSAQQGKGSNNNIELYVDSGLTGSLWIGDRVFEIKLSTKQKPW